MRNETEERIKYTGPCENCGAERAIHERNFDLKSGADLGPMVSYSNSSLCFECWNLKRLGSNLSRWNRAKWKVLLWLMGGRPELQFRYLVEGDHPLETHTYPVLLEAYDLLYGETGDPQYLEWKQECERWMRGEG